MIELIRSINSRTELKKNILPLTSSAQLIIARNTRLDPINPSPERCTLASRLTDPVYIKSKICKQSAHRCQREEERFPSLN